MKRALLSRTDAIGDLILTLPVVRSLKECHPDLHLTMLVSEYARPLLKRESYIDAIMTIPTRSLGSLGEFRELSRQLRVGDFDTIIFFYPRLSLALAAWMSGIATRVGTAYRGYSFLFNKQTKLHRKDSGKHELDLNYDLIDTAVPNLTRHEPRLTVTDEEIEGARLPLERSGIKFGNPYIVVHPLSHGSAPNWKPENYFELTRKLEEAGRTVVLTGSASEQGTIADYLRMYKSRAINLAGLTDLRRLMAVIKNASLIITGSTGPIHIASAVGTFAIGIYPPASALSATRWGPRGGSNKLFVPDVDSNEASVSEIIDTVSVESVLTFALSQCRTDIRLSRR